MIQNILLIALSIYAVLVLLTAPFFLVRMKAASKDDKGLTQVALVMLEKPSKGK